MPPPLPPPQIDYRSPSPNAPRRPIVDVRLLIVGLMFALVVSALVLFVAPRLLAVFRDFGPTLPQITVSVFGFAKLCQRGGLPVLWGMMLAPAFLAPLLRRRSPEEPGRGQGRGARLVATLVLALFTAWIVVGLFLPYVRLIEAVSGGATKK